VGDWYRLARGEFEARGFGFPSRRVQTRVSASVLTRPDGRHGRRGRPRAAWPGLMDGTAIDLGLSYILTLGRRSAAEVAGMPHATPDPALIPVAAAVDAAVDRSDCGRPVRGGERLGCGRREPCWGWWLRRVGTSPWTRARLGARDRSSGFTCRVIDLPGRLGDVPQQGLIRGVAGPVRVTGSSVRRAAR